MNDTNPFIQLFSDEHAKPDSVFIKDLELQFKKVAMAKRSTRQLNTKQKLIAGLVVLGITLLILALVFLPRRDMADPKTDSLVESVVDSTQQSIQPFSSEPLQTNASSDETTPTGTQQSSPTANATPIAATTPPQTTTPTPASSQSVQTITSFQASFWNLDPDSAVAPDIPTTSPNATSLYTNIDFNWGASSPIAGIFPDGFVARFNKESSGMSGQYRVDYSSDNGLRMHVNETVVFDFWNSTSSNGTAYFTTDPASPVTSITIDYYESDGPAQVYVQITKVN